MLFIAGNKSKCRGLLRKGKDFGAQPIDLLLKAYDNFVEGKKVLIDDCDELTLTGFNRVKQKSSESSVDSSPLSTGMPTFTRQTSISSQTLAFWSSITVYVDVTASYMLQFVGPICWSKIIGA